MGSAQVADFLVAFFVSDHADLRFFLRIFLRIFFLFFILLLFEVPLLPRFKLFLGPPFGHHQAIAALIVFEQIYQERIRNIRDADK